MLETVSRDKPVPTLESIFDRADCTLTPLDQTLFRVFDRRDKRTRGFVEKLVDRYPVFYTCESSKNMDPWVNHLVRSSSWLDHLWLSGRAFEQLMRIVLKYSPGNRYGRIVFQHESFFELGEVQEPGNGNTQEEEESQEPLFPGGDIFPTEEPDTFVSERRSTRFTVLERLEVLKDILPNMQKIYHPLHAIAQVRFPARGRGGHDFYYFGKVTNRSDSFTDHRQHIQFVLRIYKKATEDTETAMWQAKKVRPSKKASGEVEISGAPVLLKFGQQLSHDTFDRFVRLTFGRKDNRFRLWGNPIRLGPCKVHIYGLDRHLWQPIFLELTDSHIVAIVPEGTCGNSIHRLVTNVQQFLDPAVEVWVGEHPYTELINAEPGLDDIYATK
jgi:hypothetical protein